MVSHSHDLEAPEQAEAERLGAELAELLAALAEAELELATVKAQLSQFEDEYLRRVASRMARLDSLVARSEASGEAGRGEATRADPKARREDGADQDVHGGANEVPKRSDSSKFEPTEDSQALYRRLARRLHPDLASDDKEREARTVLMAEVNEAYSRGDIRALRRIEAASMFDAGDVRGSDVGAVLVRRLREIASVKRRLSELHQEYEVLERSPLFALWTEVNDAAARGRDLLQELCDELDREIASEQAGAGGA